MLSSFLSVVVGVATVAVAVVAIVAGIIAFCQVFFWFTRSGPLLAARRAVALALLPVWAVALCWTVVNVGAGVNGLDNETLRAAWEENAEGLPRRAAR